MMNHHALIPLCLALLLSILSTSCAKPPDAQNDWDLLIFTQRWPMTACSQWEERGKNNTCAFPSPPDLWTIHGIWPTKAGTRGPYNCNNTWHFNATLIAPIEADLEEYWTNVEANTKLTSLWQHEWSKHGTCAASLPQLNNEFNYFHQGLQWVKAYNMKGVLGGQQVVPKQEGYTVEQISSSVKAVLGVNAIVECVIDRYTKQSFISELRICFDKELRLMDCDSVKDLDGDVVKAGDVLTNCNLNKPVVYPDRVTPVPTTTVSSVPTITLPPMKESSSPVNPLESRYQTRRRWIAFYRTIKLLIWATI